MPRMDTWVLLLAAAACDGAPDSPPSHAVPTAPTAKTDTTSTEPPPPCDCPSLASCRVMGRHPIHAKTRSRFGLFVDARKRLACDTRVVDCGELGTSGAVVEVTESCGLWMDRFVVTTTDVFVAHPQSIGQHGGPGYSLASVEGADPMTFVPLGHGFARDRERVYLHGTPIGSADAASFEVVDCSERSATDCVARDRYRSFGRGAFD